MRAWWVKLLGTPVGRALGWEPKTWRTSVLFTGIWVAVMVLVADLLGLTDFRRDPAEGLILGGCVLAVRTFAFLRDHRRDVRDAERQDAQARADRSNAG